MSTFSIQGARMPEENRAAQQSETGQPSQSGQIAEDYRGTHRAPRGEFGEGSLDAMDRTYPDDLYSPNGARYYGDTVNASQDRAMHRLILSLRGKPDASVKVYRAAPKGVASEINPGDWVTPNRAYAEMHGDRFDEGFDIIERTVKAKELFTEGNSLFEFGWNPRPESPAPSQGAEQAPTFQASNATIVGPTTFSIDAFHGTPHKIDPEEGFRLDRIGTGEGAQAYGYGLYFAESKGVARGYRDRLAVRSETVEFAGENQEFSVNSREWQRWSELVFNIKNPSRAYDSWSEVRDDIVGIAYTGPVWDAIREAARSINSWDAVSRLNLQPARYAEKANLYTVTLDVEPEQLLDWDKPLSEQSERVKKSIADAWPHTHIALRGTENGQAVYSVWQSGYGETAEGTPEQKASRDLLAAGIPGTRFLDGQSRGKGQGSYNYVIFDESIIKITEENGKQVSVSKAMQEQGAETTFSISPAMAKLDADYMAAVERGDMDAAQKMVDEAQSLKIPNTEIEVIPSTNIDRIIARLAEIIGDADDRAVGLRSIYASEVGAKDLPNSFYRNENSDILDELSGVSTYRVSPDFEFGFPDFKTEKDWLRKALKESKQAGDQPFLALVVGDLQTNEIFADPHEQVIGSPEVIAYIPRPADPVTRDEQGNVIPLSQRFNPERPEITYSISPYEAFEMDPVIQFLMENRVLSKTAARKQLGAERFKAIAAIWDDVPVMAHPSHNAIYGDRGLYPDEAATMLSNMELLPSGATAPDLWAHVQKVSDSARRIAEQSRAQTRIATPSRMEQMDAALARLDSDPAFRRERVAMARRRLDDIQRRHGSLIAAIEVGTKEAEVPRVELIRTIAELEAITRILPPEARGNIGGYKRLAELKTDRGRVNFMVSQIGKVGTALEGWLSEQYREQIDSLLEKTGAKVDQSKIRKGRFTPEVQRVIERIKDIVKLDEAGSEKAMEDIFQKLDDATDPQVIQQLTSDLQLLEMFADMESKSAAVLEGSHRFLSSLINLGRDSRKMLDEQFRTEMAALRGEAIKEFSGGAGILGPNEALYMKQKRGNQKLRQSAYKFHLKNQSMEWLLNAATRPSKDVGTLQGKITKWASRVIHRATHQERRERTRRERAGHAELARIFGTKPGLDTARALYEYKSTIRAVTGIHVKLGRKVEIVPVDAVIAERSDAQMYALGFTAAEVEQLRKLAAENNKRTGRRKRTKLQLERVVNPGVSTELAMTMDQAVYWFMLSRQEGPKSNMERYGWDEASFSALKEFLSPQAREIVTWLSKEYAEGYGPINEVYRQIHFVDMPQVMNYSPVRYETDNRVEDNLMDGRQMMSSTSPGFIKQRQRHSAEPLTQGALDLYFRHMVDSEHYKAWALPMRELRAVLGSKDVQKTIEQQQGRDLNALIQEKLDQFAAGGRKGAFTLPTLDFIRSSFVVAKQAYNWGVALKQLTSFPAYMFDVPVLDFMQYQAEFWVNPGKNFKDMLDIPFVKQRFGEGYDRDMMKVMREFEGMEKPGTRLARAAEWGMIFTRAGDIMPVIVGGYSAYRYRQEQALAEGMSEAQAKAEAELFFEMTTERAQQAGDVKDLSWYQSGGSVARMLTMFMTSPRQYYSNVYESFLDMKAGKKGAGAEFARRFAIGQLVLPVVFQLAGDIVRNAFREPDDRELNPWDYIRAMAIGPFNGLFVMGSVLDTASHWATKGWWFESAQLTGLSEVSRINMGIGRISKMIQAGEIDPETLLKALDDFALAGSSMAGGHWVWYDIGRRLIRSVGLDDEAGELTGEFLDWVESGGNE
jgi:hypothetical protein